jgi:nitrate/nitrite transporter NarK
LGYVAFASGLPSWLFTLYGGVVADRISRRKLIIITQASMMILAFIQAAAGFYQIYSTLAYSCPCFPSGYSHSV